VSCGYAADWSLGSKNLRSYRNKKRCAMKKVLMSCAAVSILFFMVAMASAADKSATVNGYVSDSMCGAKGANSSHAACMTKCLGKGGNAVIVTDGDQKVVNVDNPDVLKGHEGHHVAVTGAMTGDTIHISSVKML
jgi:type 1 fimbria pilin